MTLVALSVPMLSHPCAAALGVRMAAGSRDDAADPISDRKILVEAKTTVLK